MSSPGKLLAALTSELPAAAALGRDVWEMTLRSGDAEGGAAAGVIMSWGFKDDSVAGHDFRMHMARHDNGWRVDTVEEQFHCWRGVTNGLCI